MNFFGFFSCCLYNSSFEFFLPCPISSFYLFLHPSVFGLEHHNGVDLSIWRELVLLEVLHAGPIFFRLRLLVTQRKIATVFASLMALETVTFLKNQSRALCELIFAHDLNPGLLKRMLFLWASWPRLFTLWIIGSKNVNNKVYIRHLQLKH